MADDTAIPPQERLILALDVDDLDAARRLVEELDDAVHFYKVGLQLFLGGGGFRVVDWLRARGKRVFLDLKLYDVPRTVAAAVGRVRGRGVRFLTVHGDAAILEAAVEAAARMGEGGAARDAVGSDRDGTASHGDGAREADARMVTGPGILAVTVLTSLDARDLDMLGYAGADELGSLVLRRARLAAEAGCEGVIASGQELSPLREAFGDRLRLVIPGIREREARGTDDQKRTVTVEEAFARGADYIVVGRPIRSAPNPKDAALRVQDRIAASVR